MTVETQSQILKGSKTTHLDRKSDHIDLAFKSQLDKSNIDHRFYYEPLLSSHNMFLPDFSFDGKKLGLPIWVSSMTGGTEKAHKINHNLARACSEFGMGMGLGSCRTLLESNDRFDDFNLRQLIGDNLPFYANLGVAQIEHLLTIGKQQEITNLVNRLNADGLIVHVNPMQEWLQPEGDRYKMTPLQIIETLLEKTNLKLIVKEVGQGFGPESLKSLLKLPLTAIDFGAHGGTNFALLELLRNSESHRENYSGLAQIGHDANEMVDISNALKLDGYEVNTNQLIISGGIKNFLDGYYLINKSRFNSVYGQASALLKHAQNDYDKLSEYLISQIEGLKLAYSYLRIKQ